MTEKRIIEKIRKLLALAANNRSAEEATAAALKAQKLIADYDVSKAELYEDEPEGIEEVKSNDIKGDPWSKHLAHVIADNFRCRLYLNGVGTRNCWTGRLSKSNEYVVFMGYRTDAEAATVTFDRLHEIGNKLAASECRKARKMYGSAYGVKNSFLMGFVDGIRKELEKQSVALVLIRPKAVDDYADEVTSTMRTSSSTIRNSNRGESYDSGVSAGRDSVRSARLKGQAALTA